MHILLITSWYNTITEPYNGIFIETQAEMLKNKNNKVGVINPHFKGGFINRYFHFCYSKTIKINNNRFPVYISECYSIFPQIRIINYLYLALKSITLFKKYIKQYGKPDIIHCHIAIPAGFVSLLISKLYSIPFILTEHHSSLILNDKKINFEDKYIFKYILYNSMKNIFVSNFLKNEIEKKYKYVNNKNIIIGNVVSSVFLTSFKPILPSDTWNIIQIGSFTENKNHLLSVKSINILKEKGYNIVLKFIGQGSQENEILQLIKELNLENNIKLIGEKHSQEIKEYFINSHLLISSSNFETFGVTIIEALACGRPVVATDSKGPRDIIMKEDGYLVSDHSPDAFAEAIEQLFKNYKTFNQQDIQNRCKERFSEDAIYQKLNDVYSSII